MENRESYGPKKQLRLRYLGKQTQCTLYITLLRPILIFGRENWPLRRRDENMLRIY
jgi:hypothetical protein